MLEHPELSYCVFVREAEQHARAAEQRRALSERRAQLVPRPGLLRRLVQRRADDRRARRRRGAEDAVERTPGVCAPVSAR